MRTEAKDLSRKWLVAVVGLAVMGSGCWEAHEDLVPLGGRCDTCHGSAARPGDEVLRSAPPSDLAGRTDPAVPSVGAHELHLTLGETHEAVLCSECHVVPEYVHAAGHVDDGGPAEFVAGPLARLGNRTPSYDPSTNTCSSVYCHGSDEPKWTEPRSSEEACGSCHGIPPDPPHPTNTNCQRCHGSVIDAEGAIIAPELHVDGQVDLPTACDACHGTGELGAPPPDLSGQSAVTAMGVGAHEVHLSGGAASRAVPCQSCHQVPDHLDRVGHLDKSPYAEVRMSGLAALGGGSPSWDRDQATCSQTWCHGPSAVAESVSASWNQTNGETDCESCHGMPPIYPHPAADGCDACHADVVRGEPGDWEIHAPELHVDGKVQLY